MAWAVLDHELTVREVRTAASAVNDGATVEAALADVGVELGRIELSLPPDLYRRLRRTAALSDRDPDDVVAEAVSAYFE